jgi:hypothetical protein
MNQQEVDERIARLKAQGDARVRTSIIPSQRGAGDILVEDGADVLAKPSPASAGQIDASVPSVQSPAEIAAEREAAAKRPPKAASKIAMDYVPGPDYLELEIGGLILRTSHVTGWEKRYTYGAGTWQVVREDGSIVSHEAEVMKLVILELQQIAAERAAGKLCPACGNRRLIARLARAAASSD